MGVVRALSGRVRGVAAVAAVAAVAIGLGMGSGEARAQTPLGGPQLSAGDIAIIGRVNNGSPDTFAIVALAPLPAGTNIFFTDNGWISAAFRTGEGVVQFTVNNAIARGRVIRSNDSSADFTWSVVSGSLDFSTSGDQLYAFQATNASSPLTTVTRHLFVLDDTNLFEVATNTNTGAIPPGLSIAGGTAITVSAIGSNTLRSTASLASGTKGDWITAISTVANWTTGGSLPSTNLVVNPYTTITDTTSTGAAVNGTLASDEYSTGNLYVFSGGGNGFGGTLGYGSFYFNSDDTNLYIGFQPGNTANDIVVLYFDVVNGGETDATMADNASTDRNVISNLGQAGNDGFPFSADYALSIWNSPALNSADSFLYDLNAGGANSLTFISGTGANPLDPGTQRIFRECSIPLASLGLTTGNQIRFFAAYCSDTLFNSNETVPAMAAINGAANPGQSSTVNYDAYAVFNPYCPSLSITDQPDSQTAYVGGTISLSVGVSGSAPSFQWRKNGTNLTDGGRVSGATTDTLSITGAVAGDAASYDCVVTGTCATLTSSAAALTVECLSPSLTTQLFASDGAAADNYGFASAISGDTLVVGAPDHNASRGEAYVYIRSGGTWTLQATLLASDGAAGDWFATSIAIDGDTIVAGAQRDDTGGVTDHGSAYVFVRSGTTWSQQAKLTASDQAAGYQYGTSVAVYGSVVVVGAQDANAGTGAAYVYERTGTVWSQTERLVASDAASGDGFGFFVAVDGTTALVGSPRDNHSSLIDPGSAYVFKKSGVSWIQQAKITPISADRHASAFFGTCVALSGGTAVIGASGDAPAGVVTGSAFVFTGADATWTQQARLVASDAALDDTFGEAVSVKGDLVAVSAPTRDTGATGDTGAVYLFTRAGSTWTQQATLTAASGLADDELGRSIGVTSDTLVAGAWADDTPAGSNAGSAFVWDLTGDQTIITDQPDATTLCTGVSGSMSVAASGTGLSYQWRRNGASVSDGSGISGATTPTITFNPAATGHAGSYDCVVTGACDSATSSAATLTVNTTTSITTPPAGGTVCTGSAFTFSVVAAGTNLHYQWFRGATPVGTDNPSYAIASAAAGDAGSYTVQVSGTCGTVTSSGVTLNVNVATSIGTQPVGGAICEGGSHTFTVVAAGTGPFSYQWKRGTTNVGTNSPSFTVASATETDQGSYTVVVTGACDAATSTGVSLAVNSPNAIVTSPQSVYVVSGGSASMSVYAEGTGLTFQWRKNGVDMVNGGNVSGATAATLSFATVSLSDEGTYTCVVDGDCGPATTSAGATLGVMCPNTPPFGTGIVASDGAVDDHFSVVALSDDTMIVGAPDEDDGFTPNTGAAYVFVRSSLGTWTQQAKLTLSAPVGGMRFGSMVGLSGNTAIIGPGTGYSAAYLFVRSGTTWTQQATVAGVGQVVSVAIWGDTCAVGSPDQAGDEGEVVVHTRTGTTWTQQAELHTSDQAVDDGVGTSVALWGDTLVTGAPGDDTARGAAYVFTRSGTTWTQQAKLTATTRAANDKFGSSVAIFDNTVAVGAPQVDLGPADVGSAYAFVRSGTTWSQQAQMPGSSGNGLLGTSVAAGSERIIAGAPGIGVPGAARVYSRSGTAWSLTTTWLSPASGPIQFGSSVAMWNANAAVGSYAHTTPAGSGAGEVFAYDVGDLGPEITDQPDSVSVCENGSATMSISGTSDSSALIFWRKNGVEVAVHSNSGTFTDSLTINPVTPADVGAYDVRLVNSCGEAISTAAMLTINPSTSIATNPVGGNICSGGGIVLTVTAAGTGPFSYQWRRDGIPVGGNSPAFGATVQGSYTVTITGACGPAVTSTPVTVNVNPPTSITTAPVDGSVCAGSGFTFSVVADGVAPFHYVWKRGSTVVGGDSASYTIASAAPGDAGSYTVQVTGNCGSVITSSPVSLTVNPTTTVATHPVGGSVCEGTGFTFTAAGGGTGPFSYQWFRGATPVGTNNPSFAIASVTPADVGTYTVQITGTCGGATSSGAALAIIPPPAITTHPVATTGFAGGNASFTVAASGTSLTYQWRKGGVGLVNGGDIAGATSTTLTISNLGVADEGSYDCVVGGDCGSATSSAASLSVECFEMNDLVHVLPQDVQVTASMGFSVAVSGDTVVLGAYRDSQGVMPQNGSVHVYVRSGGTWTRQAELQASDASANDRFGSAVAIDGNTLVVGAYWDDTAGGTDAGSAYVFTRSGTTWTQQAKLTASNGAANDNFGSAVGITGDTVVVGSPRSSGAEGSAYTFTRAGTVWTQQTILTQSADLSGDNFGNSIAIDPTTLVIGAPTESTPNGAGAGSAYVYVKTAGVWTQQARLYTSEVGTFQRVGVSVALSGNTVVAGAEQADAAYVFTRAGTTWTEETKLTPSDHTHHYDFGHAVGISGNTAVIGARYSGADNRGAAYFYGRSTGGWTQLSKYTASDGEDDDHLGAAVAFVNGRVVLGAPDDDTALGSLTGSAYIFDLVAGEPSITDQPDSLIACEGSPATLTVAATGAGSLTYQWRRGGVPLSNGGEISGATTGSLTIAHVALADAAGYDCVVTSPCSTVTSSSATLVVNTPTTVATQPVGGTVAAGDDFTFTTSAAGTGPFTYQWFVGAAPIGTNSPTLTLS